MIRVLVVDDHALVRQGLRAVLTEADIDIVGEAGDGREAIARAAELHPDVIVMDLQMPVLDGIGATRQLVATSPAPAVLVLTMYEDDDTVFAALQAGASGYLLKGSDGGDIAAAVRSAAAGHAVFGAPLAARLRSWFDAAPRRPDPPFPELTDRERDILDHLAAGSTNAEIGEQLHLSPKTIANNVSAILNKLHLTERSQAIVRAREAGLGHQARD
ncbi:MAG: response regulator transcription factor [Ilumatobacteraceae bacterium]